MPNEGRPVVVPSPSPAVAGPLRLRRFLPFAAVVILMVVILAMGWHRQLSFETLVRHRAGIDAFVAEHYTAAVAAFVGATALGIIPGTFAYALVGEGLDSVIRAEGAAFRACLAAGRSDCRLHFDMAAVLTPQLLAALAALGLIALIPILLRRWRARNSANS